MMQEDGNVVEDCDKLFVLKFDGLQKYVGHQKG